MVEFPELESLGGQLSALKRAEKLLKKPVLTQQETLQLAENRARQRQLKRQLKMELERVQLRLSF